MYMSNYPRAQKNLVPALFTNIANALIDTIVMLLTFAALFDNLGSFDEEKLFSIIPVFALLTLIGITLAQHIRSVLIASRAIKYNYSNHATTISLSVVRLCLIILLSAQGYSFLGTNEGLILWLSVIGLINAVVASALQKVGAPVLCYKERPAIPFLVSGVFSALIELHFLNMLFNADMFKIYMDGRTKKQSLFELLTKIYDDGGTFLLFLFFMTVFIMSILLLRNALLTATGATPLENLGSHRTVIAFHFMRTFFCSLLLLCLYFAAGKMLDEPVLKLAFITLVGQLFSILCAVFQNLDPEPRSRYNEYEPQPAYYQPRPYTATAPAAQDSPVVTTPVTPAPATTVAPVAPIAPVAPQSKTAKMNELDDSIVMLKRYKELLDSGTITEEEYAEKKRQLLGF